MTDFSNLAVYDVNDESLREYTFHQIVGEPSVWLSPAVDYNKTFEQERLRELFETADQQSRRKVPRTTEARVAEHRRLVEDERETYRKHLSEICCKRWGKAPRDVNGAEPEFSAESCYDFLKALPDWIFDPFRLFATNIYNFVDRPEVSEDEADELGNS